MPAKPTKADRPKKKAKKYGICIECAMISEGGLLHAEHCEKSLGVIMHIKRHTPVQFIEEAMDELCRMITTWRDGVVCVINTHECGGESQWGHVIPQGRNSYLVHSLSNSFRQCRNHNQMHTRHQLPYLNWYNSFFGQGATDYLDRVRQKHAVNHKSLPALQEQHQKLVELWQNRFWQIGKTKKELIEAGYYGEEMKEFCK